MSSYVRRAEIPNKLHISERTTDTILAYMRQNGMDVKYNGRMVFVNEDEFMRVLLTGEYRNEGKKKGLPARGKTAKKPKTPHKDYSTS